MRDGLIRPAPPVERAAATATPPAEPALALTGSR